ncbi:ketoacyl-ACP synthase III [Salirhabdus sp. Marseille-P4669]|uniref:ketoacyl-ACP synthase III n=1 Tax=Salirhabdus sp. Marseille-P4669 TaxID=2042310 RepID=UPI000C7B9548|nr:ketoacyl-ACP synthase III [Salirhabdus sp. Marseille-P4669]
MKNVKIKEIAIYHPENVVDNAFYLDHYKEKGRDATKFLVDVLGRDKRYIIDNEEENALTMAVEASRNVLAKAGVAGEDLDMIVFSSQTPEYTAPANAIHLHHVLGASHKTMTMDSNANCAGMTVAVDQASRYLLSNPHMNLVLVVGSDYNSLMSNKEQEITFGNFGDAACAVLLEKTEEETGFIDSHYYVNSITHDKTYFPRHGLTNAIQKPSQDQSIDWLPFDGDMALQPTYDMMEMLLERNHMSMEDVNAFCLSQFSIANIKRVQEHFQLADEKIMYVGDRFGYTGTTSPFIALHEGIESGRIKRGDTVLFWTIGGGFQLATMLFKY